MVLSRYRKTHLYPSENSIVMNSKVKYLLIVIGVTVLGMGFVAITMQQTLIENSEQAFSEPCTATKKPFELTAEPYTRGPPPDTYLVKVYVETTSLWTTVEVEGMQSITVASYIPHTDSDSNKNVDVEGLRIGDLSRPETTADVLPPIAAEFEAIVQKEGETAVFRINKGDSGTTIYTLYSVVGNSTEEVAQFIHDGIVEDGDNVRTFSFDLDLLSVPLALPEERYNGPLFDAHLHLTGQDVEGITGIENDRLFIHPDNADEFFAMMDTQGVIGMIGFLPINHDYFVVVPEWTDPFLKQTMELVKRHCIIPFIFPDSLLCITSREFFKIGLIDDYIKEYPIKGIGEIHVDGENPLYADIRLNDDVMFELYDYAAANNLVVMIHPRVTDLEDLRDALQHNRKTLFLLHSGEGVENIIPILLQEHDNLYYSIDTDLLYPYGIANDGMTKEKFLNNLQSDGMYYRLLASALRYWKPLIEAYPDRITWGTDALYTWHFDHDVYSEVTWFARDFIGGLSPEIQERFAFKNAERLLSGR